MYIRNSDIVYNYARMLEGEVRRNAASRGLWSVASVQQDGGQCEQQEKMDKLISKDTRLSLSWLSVGWSVDYIYKLEKAEQTEIRKKNGKPFRVIPNLVLA